MAAVEDKIKMQSFPRRHRKGHKIKGPFFRLLLDSICDVQAQEDALRPICSRREVHSPV